MSSPETPDQIVQRVADEARRAAGDLPFDERANLVRSVARAVADAIKFDATFGGAPEGREWEQDRLNAVVDAAEDYWHQCLAAKR